MKSVIKSVSPRICEKVANGDCKILISKTAPKCDVPFKGYIYATKIKKRFVRGISTLCNKALYICDHKLKVLEGWDIMDANITDVSCRADGKVIGECIIDKVERISPTFRFFDSYSGYDDSSDSSYFEGYILDDKTLNKICLTKEELCNYGNGEMLYAWYISNLEIYDKPKQISDFFKPCPDPYHYCRACKYGIITIPPDEEEYALYHGGHYDYCEEHCGNILRKPPKGWQYVSEDNEE